MLMKNFFLYLLLVPAMLVQAQTQISIDQFIQNADPNTTYRLRGVVSNITSTKYGNFDLTDDSGKILVYGLKTANGQSQQFASLGVEEGDTLTLDGKYKLYNSKPEVDPAQYVSHVKPAETWEPVPISISEFISRNDSKRYILTGVVTNITNATFGNLYIEDETDSILVWGITNFSSYDIAVNDTLTISGVYQFYSDKHEVSGAQYIRSVRPEVTPVDPPVDEGVDFLTVINNGGWNALIGQTVTFSNDFVFCGSYYDGNARVSVYNVAPYRLRAPEQYGEEGTTAYNKAVAKNLNDSIHLVGSSLNYKNHRLGTIIRNLQATVTAANQLTVVNTPTIINNALPTERPDLGNPDLVVVGANIENFFVTTNGYSGAKTEELLAVQKKKISTALAHMDADIYALCEVEQGSLAATELVRLLDSIAGKNQYSWVNAGYRTYDAIMVCFIYRSDKVQPYGSYLEPYTSSAMRYRMAIQGFEQLSTGEKFNISLNHFYAKISKTDADREDNMTKLIAKLPSATANDPDVLVLGDLNAYEGETALQMLCPGQGYVDLLQKYDPNGYSHAYNITTGFLDHAYCSPSMESQVTKAVSYHLNSDTPKSLYGYSSTGGTVEQRESMYRYADHDPILVGLKLGASVTPIENVVSTEPNAQKILRNGQIVIIRSGVEYTVTGQRLY